jgi:uncharacterized cupin superfamily protein
MKVVHGISMSENAVDHPYETNPDYESRINPFHYASDKRLVAGYWEAPVGWFEAGMGEQCELNFVIEGEIQLESEGRSISAKRGDCFILESGEEVKWNIVKPIKTFFVLYPASEEVLEFFENLRRP